MEVYGSAGNCGIAEIHGLHYSEFRTFVECIEDRDYAIFWFSDNVDGNGPSLAREIVKHKIGKLISSGKAVRNPNSGNYIKAWFLIPNARAIQAFLNPKPVRKPAKRKRLYRVGIRAR